MSPSKKEEIPKQTYQDGNEIIHLENFNEKKLEMKQSQPQSIEDKDLVERISTKISSWNKCCSKDRNLQNFKKELISTHRSYGGVCTWTDNEEFYNNIDKLKNLDLEGGEVVFVLKNCKYDYCKNELITCVKTNGEELLIEIKEVRRGTQEYDNEGHYEYYEKNLYPFDRMEEILYKKDRIWASVFSNIEDPTDSQSDRNHNTLEEENLPQESFSSKNLKVYKENQSDEEITICSNISETLTPQKNHINQKDFLWMRVK